MVGAGSIPVTKIGASVQIKQHNKRSENAEVHQGALAGFQRGHAVAGCFRVRRCAGSGDRIGRGQKGQRSDDFCVVRRGGNHHRRAGWFGGADRAVNHSAQGDRFHSSFHLDDNVCADVMPPILGGASVIFLPLGLLERLREWEVFS
jgi:hypothetical protein